MKAHFQAVAAHTCCKVKVAAPAPVTAASPNGYTCQEDSRVLPVKYEEAAAHLGCFPLPNTYQLWLWGEFDFLDFDSGICAFDLPKNKHFISIIFQSQL